MNLAGDEGTISARRGKERQLDGVQVLIITTLLTVRDLANE